jgi:copper resistance protein D
VIDAALVLLRLVQYAGAVVAFGLPLFFLVRRGRSSAGTDLWPRRLVVGAGLVTALAAVIALVVQTAVMAGSLSEGLKPASLVAVAAGTGLGLSIVVRVASALVLAATAAWLRPGRAALATMAVVGAVISASFAWSGHGAATEGSAGLVHLAADVTHTLAAGLWLGALVALAVVLRGARGQPEGNRQVYETLHGFSGLGTVAVALLVVTGLVNSWFLVGPQNLGGLLSTDYGRLLLLKLCLFGGMLALAAANRWLLTPRLGRALGEDEQVAARLSALRASLVVESCLALALLAVVALMGTLPPTAALA